jgi:hypothetical protein
MTYEDRQTSWFSILMADDIHRNRAHKYPVANHDLKELTGTPPYRPSSIWERHHRGDSACRPGSFARENALTRGDIGLVIWHSPRCSSPNAS